MSDSPAISMTISTVQGWPAIQRAIASAEAAAATDGEVMVTDGSGLPAPDPAEVQAAGQVEGFATGPGDNPPSCPMRRPA